MLGGGNAGVDQPGAERPLSPRPQRSPDTVGAARELAALAAAPAGAAGFGAAAAEASADAPAGVAGAEPAPETAQPPVPAPAPAPAPAAAARLVAAKKRLPSSVLAGPNGEVPVVGATVAGPGARVDPEEPLVFLHVGAGPSALHTPRSHEMPPPPSGESWHWAPERINADCAIAGPAGIKAACEIPDEKVTVATCHIHIERAVTQNKDKSFDDPENAAKMNVDIERLKNNSITSSLARRSRKCEQPCVR